MGFSESLILWPVLSVANVPCCLEGAGFVGSLSPGMEADVCGGFLLYFFAFLFFFKTL